MKLLPHLFLLLLSATLGRADNPAPAPAPPAGIIILKAVAGYDAAAVSFVSIQWTDTNGGYVMDNAGGKTSFVNRAIGQVIYFDQAFYDEVDHNQNWIGWRAGIQNRETILTPVNSIHLTSGDVPNLQAEEQSLEDTAQRYPPGSTLIAPLTALLKDDITKLSGGFVLQNGKWMTLQEANNSSTVPVIGEAARQITFTTKDGKKYTNVKVTVTDAGLSILTSDGGAFVPLDQLPGDLSVFPERTRAQIQAAITKKAAAEAALAAAAPPPAAASTGFIDSTESFFHRVAHRVRMLFSDSPAPSGASASSSSSATPISTVSDLTSAVVLIKGDRSQGTGFLTKTADGPVVITNLHVVAGNPNLKIFLSNGEQIKKLSLKGASDRDLAMFAIQDNHYSYLELASNVESTAAAGDEAITPGNSEGGEVTLSTKGALVAIGPQRIEISNPIYHGNSGGPVFDVKSGKVVAVVTGATRFNPQDALDRNSFASPNSAITGPLRYFGLRLDTVPSWETYDERMFVHEVIFLKAFHQETLALDVYINGPQSRPTSSEEPADATYTATMDKIQAAAGSWHGGTGKPAPDELIWALGTMVNADLDAIKSTENFYFFDRDRAKYELDYRTALKAQLEGFLR